jgi:asparaginyl-tRNA synthetase
MVEPEMAFADLDDDMRLAQAYLKHCLNAVLAGCAEDLEFLDQRVERGLLERLHGVAGRDFAAVTYSEAVGLLQSSGKKFEFPVEWGLDLQSEHERWLAETAFGGTPVFVTDYPKDIKAFYMRLNDDGRTVAAMDLLVPGVGELIGGSQREERLDVLEGRLQAQGLDLAPYEWYLDLRRYGTVPHAGFGLGFERLVQYCTGVDNIRDTIAFPRYPGHASF